MNTSKKSPVEKWITNPLHSFISNTTTGGIVLFASAILALIFANSSFSNSYHSFWEYKFGFIINDQFYLNQSLIHWVNDGLMALFFFVIGLELKREIIGGELSNPKKAILPIAAAFGGMLFPAIIYVFFNNSGPAFSGWGIPMATDIAFALGVLYVLGDKVPNSLKIFVTVLAIADDLGAVLVIAFFYTSEISFLNLAVGLSFLIMLIFANKMGVRNTAFYGIVGLGGVWLFFLMSGVHATIAAVLLAFTIPANVRVKESTYIKKMTSLLDIFKKSDPNNNPILTSEQLQLLEEMRSLTKSAMTPLQRLENGLHPIVTFIIMPVFAFANAGITFSNHLFDDATSAIALGVFFGLLIGKFIGIVGVSSLLIHLKLASLPENMNQRHLFGVGFLAAIGFTMSLFVSSLAFDDKTYILEAKIGTFAASLLGGILGYLILNKKRQ